MNKTILDGMAKAFFASAYADQADETNNSLQGEIMDQLPSEIDPAAIHAAETLYWQFEQALQGQGNGVTLDGAYVWLHGIEAMEGDTDDEKARLFGHYAAMQAMGHGVGLWEYDVAPQIEERVPYIEFGSHSLEKDYFDQPINVHFRKFPEGDVIALWYDDSASPGMVASYQHIGQHSDASPELIHELAHASIDEFMPLVNELESIGYSVTNAD